MLEENVALILRKSFPEKEILVGTPQAGNSWIKIYSSDLLEICGVLKDHPELRFSLLQVISGVDFPEFIELNYILASYVFNTELILKTTVKKSGEGQEYEKGLPVIDSVVSLWPAANWQEREIFDLLGVHFKGHFDLRRILCPDDWEGHPLRKDYVPAEMYAGMKINPEDKMNVDDRLFDQRQKEAEKQKKAEEAAQKTTTNTENN